MEQEQFYSYVKQLKNSSMNNHPIDKALLILDDWISFKWFNTLEKMGINYLTPCSIITSDSEWAMFSNFGSKTILIVSKQGFKITSNNETLYFKNTVAPNKTIFKDKKHKKHIMIVFDYYITKHNFYKEIL